MEHFPCIVLFLPIFFRKIGKFYVYGKIFENFPNKNFLKKIYDNYVKFRSKVNIENDRESVYFFNFRTIFLTHLL